MESKKLVWVVFYGLSALGKSHWLSSVKEAMEKNSTLCQIVSSDDCSKKVMDSLMVSNPALSKSEAFEQSRKASIKLFEDSIRLAVGSLKDGNNVIVLDKVMNGASSCRHSTKPSA